MIYGVPDVRHRVGSSSGNRMLTTFFKRIKKKKGIKRKRGHIPISIEEISVCTWRGSTGNEIQAY